MQKPSLSRRGALGAGAAFAALSMSPRTWAQASQARVGSPKVFDLVLEHRMVDITGRQRPAMTVNGQLPAPALRFREGEEVIINVANRLREDTSIHWHGLLLPSGQDGVPGISDGFQGIPAGTTHQYRFPLKQAGTYWYHSHSATQEQSGLYGPIVIEPARPDPFSYDRDYIVQLSDWTDENPNRVIANLKRDPSYYNYARRTGGSLLRDMAAAKDGTERAALVKDRLMWGNMRMDPTDIEDVTGYTFLVNGRSPERNYTALFRPGERVRLRFINGSAMTYQDVRIPGLRMTVVQADGNNVQPVTVDEFRIAPAETLDVIVTPTQDRQYDILGESMGRQGFARMTLATREGLPPLPLPAHRPRPVLNMSDMGMSFGSTGADRGTPRPETDRVGHVAPMDMGGMDMGGAAGGASMAGMQHGASAGAQPMAGMDHSKMAMPGSGGMAGMAGMDHSGMVMGGMQHSMPGGQPMAGMDHSKMAMPAAGGMAGMAGMDHSGMAGMNHGGMAMGQNTPANGPTGGQMAVANQNGMAGMDHGAMGGMQMADPIQQDTGAPAGAKVLSYRDLKALNNPWGNRKPDRVIEVRLTGNMERYFWSINGNKFSEAQPIVFNYGERVRLHFINETMMNHPMHLHGMWMVPDVGNGAQNPLKHVVNIKPGTEMNVDVVADAEGGWAFHCHLLYHMETGMMRKVVVQRASAAL
jgi:CopA family copper-resistance protein